MTPDTVTSITRSAVVPCLFTDGRDASHAATCQPPAKRLPVNVLEPAVAYPARVNPRRGRAGGPPPAVGAARVTASGPVPNMGFPKRAAAAPLLQSSSVNYGLQVKQ